MFTIPPLLVALFLLWADIMWIAFHRYNLRFNGRPLIVSLATEAAVFVVFSFVEIPGELRREIVRASLIAISFSMAFPLTIAYFTKPQVNHGRQ